MRYIPERGAWRTQERVQTLCTVASMEFRNLGRSGLRVSEITYGNWLTHGAQIDQDSAIACVHAALDAGITTFDTADVYARGAAESVLGKALEGVPRDTIEINTKVFFPMSERENDRGLSRKHIMESAHASLKRLGTEYIDVYQAHRFDPNTPLEETLWAFDDLVRQGKVLYIGVSEWTAEQIHSAVVLAEEMRFNHIISNQPQYNMLWRGIENSVIPQCEKDGLSQVVWSPLAEGTLTGKYKPGQEPPSGSRAAYSTTKSRIGGYLDEDILQRVQKLLPIASDNGLTPAQLAVSWVLQNPNVASAIIGASRPQQVTENAKAAGVELSPEVMAAVDEVLGDSVAYAPPASAT